MKSLLLSMLLLAMAIVAAMPVGDSSLNSKSDEGYILAQRYCPNGRC